MGLSSHGWRAASRAGRRAEHRFPLAEPQAAFELAARREGLKVVVEPLAVGLARLG